MLISCFQAVLFLGASTYEMIKEIIPSLRITGKYTSVVPIERFERALKAHCQV